MKSVFLIKTPLQLLNAVEAKYAFGLNSQDCVLIIMGDRKSQPQALNLVGSMEEWGEVLVLSDISLFFNGGDKVSVYDFIWKMKIFSKSFFNVRRLNRISRYLGKVEYIFIGYARYVYMTHFMNMTPHEAIYLLDDGNATLQLAKERKEGCRAVVVKGGLRKLKYIIKKYVQGVKCNDAEKLGFFTIYEIETSESDHVVVNKYEHIRSELNKVDQSNGVYFLGSPLCETGLIETGEYIRCLQRVKEYYNDSEMIYVSHRRENPENLDRIKNKLDIEIVEFNYPIEYQLASVGPKPKVLASFISSALDSCRVIFEEKLDIVSFKLDYQSSPVKDKIADIYESYESKTSKHFHVRSDY